jgi:hypothetical protein
MTYSCAYQFNVELRVADVGEMKGENGGGSGEGRRWRMRNIR